MFESLLRMSSEPYDTLLLFSCSAFVAMCEKQVLDIENSK